MISLLSHTGAASSAGGNITTTPISTLTASVIFAYAVAEGAQNPVFSDSLGNVWKALTTQSAPGHEQGVLYYCVAPITGASHTFNLSASNVSYPALCVAAFTGLTTSAFLDAQNGAVTASTVSTFQPGSVTPAVNGELLIAGLGFNGGSPPITVSIDSGFAITDQFYLANSYGCALAYLVQAVAAPVDPTWTVAASGTIETPVASLGALDPISLANARVAQSSLDVITLSNPHAQVFQSCLDIITIPAVVGVQIILRGVKRLQSGPSETLQDIQGAAHVKRAV